MFQQVIGRRVRCNKLQRKTRDGSAPAICVKLTPKVISAFAGARKTSSSRPLDSTFTLKTSRTPSRNSPPFAIALSFQWTAAATPNHARLFSSILPLRPVTRRREQLSNPPTLLLPSISVCALGSGGPNPISRAPPPENHASPSSLPWQPRLSASLKWTSHPKRL